MLKEHIVYQPTILFLKRITIITVPKVGSTCCMLPFFSFSLFANENETTRSADVCCP